MYPPPIVVPPGEEAKPKTGTTLHGNEWVEVLNFYTALFGAIGISPESLDADPKTMMFGDQLFLRELSPPTQHAEVIVYTSSSDQVDRALDAVHSNISATQDGDRYSATISDPDGNTVWVICDSPSSP
jgi:hypothetical protein